MSFLGYVRIWQRLALPIVSAILKSPDIVIRGCHGFHESSLYTLPTTVAIAANCGEVAFSSEMTSPSRRAISRSNPGIFERHLKSFQRVMILETASKLLFVLCLHERVLDLFAAVDRRDEDEQGAAGD